MKVFFVESLEDKVASEVLARELREHGHEVLTQRRAMRRGASLSTDLISTMRSSDVIVILLSNAALNSQYVSNELGAASLLAAGKQDKPIIPVLLERVQVPSYLLNRLYLDVSDDLLSGSKKLLLAVEQLARRESTPALIDSADGALAGRARQVAELGAALHAGRLTLVCGAGVSVGAGIPAWNELLYRLLRTTLKRFANADFHELDREDANALQGKYSTLVMGRYLKNNLGDDFLGEVRKALYSNKPTTGSIVDAIVRLARPERDGEPLDSIITFNFDALIEEQLAAHDVSHRAVFSEGVRTLPNELPVYHVHGYLPRSGKIPSTSQIVFSEDAYHSQFIEPFSWSNLTQLNKLSENTCLLIGLSLSDPNLRRLLDVSNRKNSDEALNHFLIKKVPVKDDTTSISDDLIRLLEEQDANALGLNMIWVNSFDDVPKVLDEIRNARGPSGLRAHRDRS